MPELDSPMHMRMLEEAKTQGKIGDDGVYGMHWGDPQLEPHLIAVRDHFLRAYVHPNKIAVEIGSGGGRWTRYLLGFGTVYAVDYHQELLNELARVYRAPYLHLVKNSGSDFPGVTANSVDFVFSFGCFVHLDLPVISAYFDEIKRVLKPEGCAVIHYSDKRKPLAQQIGDGFSNTTPDWIRGELTARNLKVLEEDLDSLAHSSVVRFGLESE